jgi:hypothetical protein
MDYNSVEEMGCKLMEKYCQYVDEYRVWKKKNLIQKSKKTFFHAFLFRNGLNKL